MKIELIPEKGQFYKANMHCHTNISDGTRSPEQIKADYMREGYSAVCFTDHEVLIDHSDLSDGDFVALNGYEVAIKKNEHEHTSFFMPVYHFNIIAPTPDTLEAVNFYLNNPSCPGNCRKYIDECARYSSTIDHTEYDINWVNGFLKGIADAGFLITYNHPVWSLQDARDYATLRHIHAVEIINGGCARTLRDNTSLPYEAILREGVRAVPVGGDDNHKPADTALGWTMIKAEELTYAALIDSYKKGYCYASEGPEIHSLTLEDGKIKIRTSPAARITLFSEGRYAKAEGVRGQTVTEAEFDYLPEKFGKYFRLEVRDAEGYCAFSNAYYTDEIK